VDNYNSESSEAEDDENVKQEGGPNCRRSSRKNSKKEKSSRVQRPRRSNVVKYDPDEWKEK